MFLKISSSVKFQHSNHWDTPAQHSWVSVTTKNTAQQILQLQWLVYSDLQAAGYQSGWSKKVYQSKQTLKPNYSALLLCFLIWTQANLKKKKNHTLLQTRALKNGNYLWSSKESTWNGMKYIRDEMKSSLSVPLSSICFVCTWLICTAETWAEHTEEWLGELGRDLQGPMESCCFFLVETIFWATEGKQNTQAGKAEHTWRAGHGRETQNEQHTNGGRRLHHQSLLQKMECVSGKTKDFPWCSKWDSRTPISPGENQRTKGKNYKKQHQEFCTKFPLCSQHHTQSFIFHSSLGCSPGRQKTPLVSAAKEYYGFPFFTSHCTKVILSKPKPNITGILKLIKRPWHRKNTWIGGATHYSEILYGKKLYQDS